MRKPVVLITGASGEIGHGLIDRLADDGARSVVTLDVAPLQPAQARRVLREVVASILDRSALERVLAEFEIDTVFHLAALLSTRSEFSPMTAHDVNVQGDDRSGAVVGETIDQAVADFARGAGNENNGFAHGSSVKTGG